MALRSGELSWADGARTRSYWANQQMDYSHLEAPRRVNPSHGAAISGSARNRPLTDRGVVTVKLVENTMPLRANHFHPGRTRHSLLVVLSLVAVSLGCTETRAPSGEDRPDSLIRNIQEAVDIRFSKDGRAIAVLEDEKLHLLHLSEEDSWRLLASAEVALWDFQFSADDRFVIGTAFGGGAIYVWSLADGSLIHQHPYEPIINALVVPRSGAEVFTGADDGAVITWKLSASGLESRKVASLPRGVLSADIARDGEKIVMAVWGGKAYVIDSKDGKVTASLQVEDDWLESVLLAPNGEYLATTSSSARVQIWDTNSWKMIREWDTKQMTYAEVIIPGGHHVPELKLHVSPDSSFVSVESLSSCVAHLWRVPEQEEVALPVIRDKPICSVQWSNRSEVLGITEDGLGRLIVYGPSAEKVPMFEAQLASELLSGDGPVGVAISPQGNVFAVQTDSGLLIKALPVDGSKR